MQIADERQLARGLVIDLEGLSGNVLGRAQLQRLSLSDRNGEFLIVQDVEVSWSGLRALTGVIDIEQLNVSHADLLRRPNLAPSQGGSSSFPNLRIGRANIQAADIREPVLGQAAHFRISGSGNLQENRELSLNIERLDAAGDQIRAQLVLHDDGRIEGSVNGLVSGAGPLAAILPLSGRDLEFQSQLSGSQSSADGTAIFRLGQAELASAVFGWSNGNWTSRVTIQGEAVEALLDLPFAPEGEIWLGGPLAPFSVSTINAQGAGWTLEAQPAGDQRINATLTLDQSLIRALSGDRANAEQARWSGQVDWQGGLVADGIAELTDVEVSGVQMSALGGSILLTRDHGEISLYTNLTGTDLEWPEGPAELDLPWLGFELTARQDSGSLIVENLEISADGVTISGAGEYERESATFAGDLSGRIGQIERFTASAAGSLAVSIDVLSLSSDSARLGLEIDATGLSAAHPTLRIISRDVVVQGQLETDYSRWNLSAFNARGRSLLAEGRASGTGTDWQATLDAAVTTNLNIANASLAGGAALALQAEGNLDSATGIAELTTDTIQLANQMISTPRLGVEFVANRDQQTANWQLSGRTSRGDLAGIGMIENSANELAVFAEEISLGRYSLQVRVQRADEVWTGRATAGDWRTEAFEIAALEVDLTQTEAGLSLSTTASGTVREAFSLEANAIIHEGVATMELEGHWSDIPIRTVRPSTYRFSGVPALDAEFRAGDSAIRIDWVAEERLRASIQDLPAETLFAAINRPTASGVIEVEADLSFEEGRWTGPASATLAEFRLRRLQSAAAANLSIDARLTDAVSANISIESAEISGRGQIRREGAVSGLRQLMADAPLSGRLNLSGAIAPLLGIMIADVRQISGNVTTDLALAGSVRQPTLSGQTVFTNGQYRSTELGVDVGNVEAQLDWEDGRVVLDSLTAASPGNGTISADGVAQLTENGWQADITTRFERFNAVRRPDLNIIASGESQIRATADRAEISGTVRIDQLNARPPDANTASFAEIDVTEINRPDGTVPRGRNTYPVLFDVNVTAPGNLFVSGELFSSEWRTEMQVNGSTVKPQINGEAVLVDGRAFLLNRAFRLQEGRVALSGAPNTAEIDLLARHSRESLTVDARLTGPVSAPSIQLSSEPSLPEDEILARLIFDRNSGQLSALETATIAAQLSGQNLFGIVGGLRRAAGLDRLDIATSTDGQLVVTGGEQISDNVYLELESRGVALSSARLEWSLSPDLTLLSRLTGDTEASIALRWRAEY